MRLFIQQLVNFLMIKPQNRVNYMGIILFAILETAAIIGAYAAHHFTKTRMGMLRHMTYLNSNWENTFPISMIKSIAICFIIALTILVCLVYLKKRVNSLSATISSFLTIMISGWTVYFLLAYDTGSNRAYYILSICFILITVFQNALYYCIASIKSE